MLYGKEQGSVCLEAFQGHGKQNPSELLRCSCVLGWRETSWLTPPPLFPVAAFPALGPFPQHIHPSQCSAHPPRLSLPQPQSSEAQAAVEAAGLGSGWDGVGSGSDYWPLLLITQHTTTTKARGEA